MLEKFEVGNKELPDWMKYLSTHPAAVDRVQMLQDMAQRPGFQMQPLLKGQDWTAVHKNKKENQDKKD